MNVEIVFHPRRKKAMESLTKSEKVIINQLFDRLVKEADRACELLMFAFIDKRNNTWISETIRKKANEKKAGPKLEVPNPKWEKLVIGHPEEIEKTENKIAEILQYGVQ
jgi:hypothetical protein